MSGNSEEPPTTMEAGPPEDMIDLKESCEQSKNQLVFVKDIMLKNKQSLKKKEEELQEYAKKLSKFKTRKASRSIKDDATTSSNESTPKSNSKNTDELSENVSDDISQAKTPKAKSSLLQKKLAEDRKIFEQRSKEINENKRAVEEKVEALRQQLEEKYVAPVSVVSPVLVTTQANHHIAQFSQVQDKDNKISELNKKIIEMEAIIIDLQDNLKEKDSVIDAKTKAVTLMSENLSRKGKNTLDTLEDTKDEMRSMQENFVLLESSLRNKNDSLIKQLEERNEQILKLEDTVDSLTHKLETQKEAEVISADFSKSTMDTLVDTKDAMKAMQENFVLVETSLKSKNEYLLKQLEERELKLAEAEARILSLESGLGIERQPNIENLIYKVEKLEQVNHNLQDEKFELQKSIAELQDKFISSDNSFGENLLVEKDNAIIELKKCNEILELDNKELVKKISDLNEKNEAMNSELTKLKEQLLEIRGDNEDLSKRLTVSESDISKENVEVKKLTKELEELNKTMIKLKAQHKNKLKSVQRQLENFKKISDTNAELIKLGNQVALLEEEKGNLQLSLVDFDELKASAGDWQKRLLELEGKVSAQAKEIEAHIEAIAILENQKLDLMQEQHSLRQEISSLEAENAESENLRVRAEMKLVDLEEELESAHRVRARAATEGEAQLPKEVGSSESFVKTGSTESSESLEAEADKAQLLREVEALRRENGALLEKVARLEEKGSSDTGSTESFERIPEQGLAEGDASTRLDNLQRENYELVVKLTKLQERQAFFEETDLRLQQVTQEKERLLKELAELRGSLPPRAESELEQAADQLASRIEKLAAQNESLSVSLQEVERQNDELEKEKRALVAKLQVEPASEPGYSPADNPADNPADSPADSPTDRLEAEIQRCNALISEQNNVIEEMRAKIADKEEELAAKASLIASCEASALESDSLRRELEESASHIAELRFKCTELEGKIESVEQAKRHIEEGLEALQLENSSLREDSAQKEALVASLRQELEGTLGRFEGALEEQRQLVASRDQLVHQLRNSLASKEEELQQKHSDLDIYSGKLELLQSELKKLQSLLDQRDASIASSAEELETWKTNSSALAAELLSARQQLTTMEELLAKSRSSEEYQHLSDQMKLKEIQVGDLEKTLAEGRKEITELKSRLEELAREKHELREALMQEKNTLIELQVDKRKQEEILQDLAKAKVTLERQLQEVAAAHEQSSRSATEALRELQEAYRQLEQLKIKHTEDMEMLNHRLENLLEELEAKAQESASLQSELLEKSKQLGNSVPQEIKTALEESLTELQKKLSEAEERAQVQLEKMKKYAAVAKKKSAQCEELEAKISVLEEKLAAETVEKEVANNLAQQFQSRDHQKDNRVSELEEELRLVLIERDGALQNAEIVKLELAGEEERCHSLKAQLIELNEAKDRARELGVRMEVMEAEYVEQLALINSLKTENGLLLSKQAQINERLENVEKESEERRVELEKSEREREVAQQARQEEPCARCAERIQRLEERLHECEAEIEHLNVLRTAADSSEGKDATVHTCDELVTAHEELKELKAQLEEAERDGKSLAERTAKLEEANATMYERLEETERQLAEAKELALAQENIGAQYSQLLDQFEKQRAELELTHSQLEESLMTSEKKESELQERIQLLEQTNASVNRDSDSREKRQVDDGLPLFDPSVFGEPSSQNRDDSTRVQEAQLVQLREEINILKEDLKMSKLSQEQVQTRLDEQIKSLSLANDELLSLQDILAKKEEEISRLHLELLAIAQTKVESEPKHKQLEDDTVKLAGELEKSRSENEELKAMHVAYKLRLSELEKETKSGEASVIAELENRISRIVSERDILQLQMNEAANAFEELRESQNTVKKLQVQLQTVMQEKERLLENLSRLEISAKVPAEVTPDDAPKEAPEEAPEDTPEDAPEDESRKALTSESMWETDEDLWTTLDKANPLIDQQHVHIPVVPSAEIQLKLKLEEIEELEERLSLMNDEKAKLLEESRIVQIKNVKYAKKLKEYKLQLDELRQRIQSEKSRDSFGELDSAIQDELKGQIERLEKALLEAGEEKKKLTAEKENQARRIEVLTAATERFAEAKEKQDTEMHIWQMRYRELEMQLQKLDFGAETREASSSPDRSVETDSEQPGSQLELKELRENVEALATENEELQRLLEEQRSSRQAPINESHLRELESRLIEVQSSNEKLKLDYESLRKQYEQALMDTDDETRILRQNQELLNKEWTEREAEAHRTLGELHEKLEGALAEKAEVEATLAERLQETVYLKAQLEASAARFKEQAPSTLDTESEEERGTRELPMFTFGSDVNEQQLQALRIQLEEKNAEIQQLQDSLKDNSLAQMIQHLQDSINLLYNEKECLEKELGEKNDRINSLINELKEKEEEQLRSVRLMQEPEELMKLQNELQEHEQQLNQLRYSLAEKESQLKVALEDIATGCENRDSADKLKNDLYDSQAEVEALKFTVSELQSEVATLRGLERLAAEDRAIIEKLTSEKEEIRREAQQSLKKVLEEKESEINKLKQELASEKENLLASLGVRERDIENIRIQIEQKVLDRDSLLKEKEQLLGTLENELSDRDRRLAELSITKDQEIHNLRVQLSEKMARIEELTILSGEEERQLTELRTILEVKEQQIHGLSQQLEEKSKEFELIQRALQRHMPSEYSSEQLQQVNLSESAATFDSSESSVAKELDVALYMLHQRDVRCEELTLELMQLLEERDTLQLRLSNAIRINEELRKYASTNANINKFTSLQTETSKSELLLEDPTPSKPEGSFEITKAATKLPIDEDNKALAQKLSQLRSVSHGKDVRLRDERELRHSQQMSLLVHKDALTSLPPEAAARLVDANYTVSRDVQSQSSVLMNWLWGKSTPKVVHM